MSRAGSVFAATTSQPSAPAHSQSHPFPASSSTSWPSSNLLLFTGLALFVPLFFGYHHLYKPLLIRLRDHMARKKSQELLDSTDAERNAKPIHNNTSTSLSSSSSSSSAVTAGPSQLVPPSAQTNPKSHSQQQQKTGKKQQPAKQTPPVQPSSPAGTTAAADPVPTTAAVNATDPKARPNKPKKHKKKPKQQQQQQQPGDAAKQPPTPSLPPPPIPVPHRSFGIQAAASVTDHFAQTAPRHVQPSPTDSDIHPEDAVDGDVDEQQPACKEQHRQQSSCRPCVPMHRRENTLTRDNVAALAWSAHRRQQSHTSNHSPETANKVHQQQQQTPRQARHWNQASSSSSSSAASGPPSVGAGSSAAGIFSPRSAATSLSSNAAQPSTSSLHMFPVQETATTWGHEVARPHQGLPPRPSMESDLAVAHHASRQRTRSATSPPLYRAMSQTQQQQSQSQPLPSVGAQSWGSPDSLPQQQQQGPPDTPGGHWTGRQANFTPQHKGNHHQQQWNRDVEHQQQVLSLTLSMSRSRSQAASPFGRSPHAQYHQPSAQPHHVPSSPAATFRGYSGTTQEAGTSFNNNHFSQSSANTRALPDLTTSESIFAYNQLVNAELLRRQQQQQQLLSMSIAHQQAQSMVTMSDQMRLFGIGPAVDTSSIDDACGGDRPSSTLPAVTLSNSYNGPAQDLQSFFYDSSCQGLPGQRPVSTTGHQQTYKMPIAQQPRFANQLLGATASKASPSRPMSRTESLSSAVSWGNSSSALLVDGEQPPSRDPSPCPSLDPSQAAENDSTVTLTERVAALQDQLRAVETESVRRRKEVEWAEWELQQAKAEAAQSNWEKDEKIRELEWALHKTSALSAPQDKDRDSAGGADRRASEDSEHLEVPASRNTFQKPRDLARIDTKRVGPQPKISSSTSPHLRRPEGFAGDNFVQSLQHQRNPSAFGKRSRRGAKSPGPPKYEPAFRRGSAPNLYPNHSGTYSSSNHTPLPGAVLPPRSQSLSESDGGQEQEVDIQLRMDPQKFRSLWSDPSRFTDMGLELESDFGNRSSDSGDYSADEGSWVGSIASNWTRGSKSKSHMGAEVAGGS